MFSKNIFSDIKALIFPTHGDKLNIRGEHKNVIDSFLVNPTTDTAFNLFKFIQVLHKKEYVFGLMNELRLYEKGFVDMLPDHRGEMGDGHRKISNLT